MCKVKNCYGDVVEIDELLIPTIIELNKKGYKTKYCCSGHYDTRPYNSYSSYIYFQDNIILPNLPSGYMYEQDLYPWVNWEDKGRDIIRIDFDGSKNINELSKDIINNAISVLEWAEGLPELNQED